METPSSRENRARALPAHLREALRRRLSGQTSQGTIGRASRDGVLPLAPSQQRLWFLDELSPGDPGHNSSLGLRLLGVLDVEALRTALRELAARHESLRTVFADTDGRATQHVLPEPDLPLRVVDGHSDRGVEPSGDALPAVVRAELNTGFDLRSRPPVRALLVRLAPEEHLLVLSMHHIITDGWSAGVITREIPALYTAALEGTNAGLPDLPVQYADYAVWQRDQQDSPDLRRQLDYWRRQLADLAPVELPTDRPRPTTSTSAGAVHEFRLPNSTSTGLRELSEQRGVTLFMTLTALTQLWLSRRSGQDDIALGTVTSGRDHPELERLVGFFVNTLVLRTRVSESRAFADLLDSVKATVLDAFGHREVPFDRVVEALAPNRDRGGNSLVRALLVLQNTPSEHSGPAGLRIEDFPLPTESARFDLTLELREDAEGLVVALEYATDLFDAGTVERWARDW
uniref:condensation domain-containing protein n=1 Tax=Actinoalloteichus spitiensis TaxID=252394 RepID=UPI001FE0C234